MAGRGSAEGEEGQTLSHPGSWEKTGAPVHPAEFNPLLSRSPTPSRKATSSADPLLSARHTATHLAANLTSSPPASNRQVSGPPCHMRPKAGRFPIQFFHGSLTHLSFIHDPPCHPSLSWPSPNSKIHFSSPTPQPFTDSHHYYCLFLDFFYDSGFSSRHIISARRLN